jgi:hypothetical protein
MRYPDDPQVRASTAEVMTIALVATTFFGGKTSKSPLVPQRVWLYMPQMISKSRLTIVVCTHRARPLAGTTVCAVGRTLFKKRYDAPET